MGDTFLFANASIERDKNPIEKNKDTHKMLSWWYLMAVPTIPTTTNNRYG